MLPVAVAAGVSLRPLDEGVDAFATGAGTPEQGRVQPAPQAGQTKGPA